MGVETVAVASCLIPDSEKHEILHRFIRLASDELTDFQEWQNSHYSNADRTAVGGFWCVGDEKVVDLLDREGWVSFELVAPSVIGTVGRFSAYLWTTMRESIFFQEPKPQCLLRRLAEKFAAAVGSQQVIYVPDSALELSMACEMVCSGKTFEEILAFAKSLGDGIPAPPPDGMNAYKMYAAKSPLYFVDTFTGESRST